MKNLIGVFFFVFSIFIAQTIYSQNISLSFMGSEVVFGSASSDFLSSYTKYKIDNEASEPANIVVYKNEIEGTVEYGGSYWFKIYFKFYNDKLFMMEISERWAPEKYTNELTNLVKQFKIVKEENNDEEGGWFNQELKKGKLKGSFSGGGEATFFKCYDINVLKEIRKQNPNYGE